jgi:hypothetical protein
MRDSQLIGSGRKTAMPRGGLESAQRIQRNAWSDHPFPSKNNWFAVDLNCEISSQLTQIISLAAAGVPT